MRDAEPEARLEEAMPWGQDGTGLARSFGLGVSELARVTIHHVDFEARGLHASEVRTR
jgi:hypothetical protein